nr:hypothetical protein [Tanacetum cinerariifolium]
MESLSSQVVFAAKLSILNPNEFDLWKMMIEQCFLMTVYSLWEVILNGDFPIPTRVIDGVVQPVAPTTAEKRLARKNKLKACSTLLMALPDKHQLKFNTHKDAKSLMEAIEKWFDGNKETKKVQKTFLKQQYENFTGSSSKSLDQIHDRLQKLISQLKILRESLSQEDVNLKFLRSLPTEWRTHTLIWRIKTDLEDQSLDDLFNSLKIYEAEVKSSSSTSPTTKNIDFVSSQNIGSANVFSVSAASTKVHVSALPNVDTLSDDVIYSFFASQSNSPQLDNDDLKQIDADDLEKMDLKWQMAMLTIRARRRGHFARECRSPKTPGIRRLKGGMFQWRLLLLMHWFHSVMVLEAMIGAFRQKKNQPTMPSWYSPPQVLLVLIMRDNALVDLRKKFEKAEQERDELKLKLDKFQTSLKNLSQLLASQTSDKTGLGYDNHVFNSTVFYCDEMFSYESDVFHDAPTVTETVPTALHVEPSPTKPDMDLSQSIRPSAPIIEDWVFDLENESEGYLLSQLSILSQLQTLGKTFQSLEAIDIAGLKRHVLFGNPQHAFKDKGVIDSGCSRHMTGNISYLFDFEEINGGYVAFGGNPKGGKITCKDTKCIVFSSDFKLPDDNHVSLRVHRENNMYNVDLKNIVPSGDFTCLFAKATLDEVLVTKPHNKTPYELLLGRTPSIGFMRPFGCPVTILNTLDPLGSGPTWLFDIDTLTKSMNYQPVITGNQPNPSADPHNTDVDATFEVKEHESEVHVSPSSSAKTKKHDDKTKREAKGKSLIELSTGVRNLSEEFEDFSSDSTNGVNAASTPVPAVQPNSTNSTNTFSAVGPSNNVVRSNFELGGQYSYVDPSQYPDDPDMPALEDIDDEEDVGADAGFSNLETKRTMDVKSAFLYETIKEEVYVCQPLGFEDLDYPDKVYVDDIIFRCTNKDLCKAFEKLMKDKFQMSSMGELTFFLGLQVKQNQDGIFISHDKYVAEILRKFGLTDRKSASTPIDTEKHLLKDLDVKRIFSYLKGKPHLGLWYLKDSPFNLVAYSDSDYARASLDRKSTTRGCQFLGCRLISWQCKKQTVVATSSTEAEYVAAANNNFADLLTKAFDVGRFQYFVQFRSSVSLKKTNDVVRLQALIDRRKVIITEDTVRQALRLDDAKSIDCLPNVEIFAELARMEYEKPSTKLTFYKAFFLAQWKFLIHTILQCMSAKRMAWNEFSSSMASAVICLAIGRKFNFSKYIFDSLVRNVDSSFKFYMYQRFLQLMINAQIADLSSHTTTYTSPTLTQKVFANMRRIGKGFFGVDTPLFERMLVPQQVHNGVNAAAEDEDVAEPTPPSPTPAITPPPPQQEVASIPPPSPHQSPIAQPSSPPQPQPSHTTTISMDLLNTLLETSKAKGQEIGEEEEVESFWVEKIEEEPAKLEEVIEVVTTAKLMTEVVTAAATTITAAPSAAKRRKGVVIRDPEETATPSVIVHSESKSKDKGKGILNEVIEQVKRKEKQDNIVMRYLDLKRKPQTEAQARKNMMVYLKNMAGFKMDFFKEASKQSKRKSETSKEKAAKKQKLDEEVEELKTHLQIVPNDEDDVYTEATPLALKVPVVDYQIHSKNNKPYYKIIRADGTRQLFLSFISLLRNFDREDLEMLWQIIQERFASSEPKNFSDDFILNTLKAMFEKPNVKASIWKIQRGSYGLAKVKSWKLLESCRVYIITFITTQMILLVERRYPWTRFTLDQMLNNVRLEVKEESEVSLELLRFVRRQQQEEYRPE